MQPRQTLLPPEPADPPTVALADAASALNAGLSDREDALTATLGAITSLALQMAPGAEYAGLVLCRRGRPEPAGPTTPATELDRLQIDLGEGPAVDMLRAAGAAAIEVTDLTGADTRWPAFAPAARERGVTALLSIALVPRDRPLAALTLYARHTPLPGTAAALLSAFAVPAAMALHAARRVAGLDQAVCSRDLIGQAKGVLMQRDGIGPDEAFDRLVAASQHTNLKLLEVARWLVEDAARG